MKTINESWENHLGFIPSCTCQTVESVEARLIQWILWGPDDLRKETEFNTIGKLVALANRDSAPISAVISHFHLRCINDIATATWADYKVMLAIVDNRNSSTHNCWTFFIVDRHNFDNAVLQRVSKNQNRNL